MFLCGPDFVDRTCQCLQIPVNLWEYSRQMEQKLLMQKQHYEELTQKMDEISKMRHDMRHHLARVMLMHSRKDTGN